MQRLWRLARTAWALGLANLWRVFVYRAGVRTGLNPVRRLQAAVPQGRFFAARPAGVTPPVNPDWWTGAHYFGAHPVVVSAAPPDWHANPLTGQAVRDPLRPWWQIPDFDPAVGDIKAVWEASRFDWVLALAQRARSGHEEAAQRLQHWLADWAARNPPYCGPNWKCGQEASLRVLHLAFAAQLLGEARAPQPALLDLVALHLQRIAPTLGYAVAQDNNHGTSEAAALFVGGSWLAAQRPHTRGAHWAALGRRWLENRVARLVAPDGSFSQHSLTYHRVLLDTLCMAELWRRELALPAFSATFQARAQAATEWLRRMTRPGGDGPNLGANDGARLLPLAATAYRDFRPSVQLAAVLFCGYRAYAADGDWNLPLRWLGLALPAAVAPPPASALLDHGGYACLVHEPAFVLLRYPRFRFRPAHADALHLDFWLGDDNVLRDGGSYSYNTAPRWLDYFPGTAAHNTVQFDGRDQMPRLGRFLFGAWLRPRGAPVFATQDGRAVCAVAYRDSAGAEHHRRVELLPGRLTVTDTLGGRFRQAVLRWRLRPGAWQLAEGRVSDGRVMLTVGADRVPVRLALAEGWESRHYLQRQPLPVLEVEVHGPGVITTVIEWAS